ncbi:hypothetical protein ACFFWB_10005 [Flavobacterium procerum]|uniref:hypothetical protein n=1 Tax=Flavobacterium procerum TaxID=1455569 RepID=UPI0035E862D3
MYNNQMIQSRQIANLQILDNNLNFTCAASVGSQIFIGTKEKGLFSSALTGNAVFENNTPSGPARKFKIFLLVF